MEDAKLLSVPLNTSITLDEDGGEALDRNKFPYSRRIGILLYLTVYTRPDIAQAVGALSNYMAPPLCTGVQRLSVLRYLLGTKSFGLCTRCRH